MPPLNTAIGPLDDPSVGCERVRVDGKFLRIGEERFFVRGVTYGTFRPGGSGRGFPSPEAVENDFAAMAANGVNAVRVYNGPPRWLLDQAALHGLRVMVGVPWAQHVAFLDEPRRVLAIEEQVRGQVERCAGHPAVLCFSVGNEIPASIVRWAGRRRVERHLERLYRIVKATDPEALVTYGNFPSTEYLDLSFLDLACFNVYLEHSDRFRRYLPRLQNIAGDRPLLLGELGLDSRRHGELAQARTLHDQVSGAFRQGCAGVFVFSWTDEWHRGGHDVEDWDFGLTTRRRSPKPALSMVRRAFAGSPFPAETRWPRVSVVVCVYNGEATLQGCLDGLGRLDYPSYEVIVVDDGSTDGSARIAAGHDCRLIRTDNRGLSSARNTGLDAATGDIVAYIDADASPDRHWLHYLVETLQDPRLVGVGGPNLPYPGAGVVADCVAHAPGGPIHVLLSDQEAEHLPGCNMAFRREALVAVGGFDPRFRVAGDDVDLCWRLQQQGWKLGFSAAAVVWHHQRPTISGYWRQQRGYGRAEALLEEKWPEKYNAAGQVAWSGRVYAKPLLYALGWTTRVYHGIWGTAPFQPRHSEPGVLTSLAAAPEWYLVLAALVVLSLLGLLWPPLLGVLPLCLLAIGASTWRALRGAALTRLPLSVGRFQGLRRRVLIALLFLLQPAARLYGRWSSGLTPWRLRRSSGLVAPRPRQVRLWSERWRDTTDWLRSLERRLRERGAVVQRGGPYDRWDLQVRDGACGVVRLRMCVEEHGGGKQLVRFRVWPWPRLATLGSMLAWGPALVGTLAALDGAWLVASLLGLVAGVFSLRLARQCGGALALALEQLRSERRGELVLLGEPRLETAPRLPRSDRVGEAG